MTQFEYKDLEKAMSLTGKPHQFKPIEFDTSLKIPRRDFSDIITRTPINRQAALVTSPAPWWAVLNHKPDTPNKDKGKRNMSKNQESLKNDDKVSPGLGEVTTTKTSDFSYELIGTTINKFAKKVDDAESLLERATDANNAIQHMADNWPAAWFEFCDQMTKYMNQAREKKAAIELMNKQMMSGLRDIRKFLFDDTHTEEVARLEKFVSLCERLKALKESGFLDKIADTLIDLNIKE